MPQARMQLRFPCPHCRALVDPLTMDLALGTASEFRICPACDTPVWFADRDCAPLEPLARERRETAEASA